VGAPACLCAERASFGCRAARPRRRCQHARGRWTSSGSAHDTPVGTVPVCVLRRDASARRGWNGCGSGESHNACSPLLDWHLGGRRSCLLGRWWLLYPTGSGAVAAHVCSTSRPRAGTSSPYAFCDTGAAVAGAGRNKCNWAAGPIPRCTDGGRAAETGVWGAPARWDGRGGARGGAEGGPSCWRARAERGSGRHRRRREGEAQESTSGRALRASPGAAIGTIRLFHNSARDAHPTAARTRAHPARAGTTLTLRLPTSTATGRHAVMV